MGYAIILISILGCLAIVALYMIYGGESKMTYNKFVKQRYGKGDKIVYEYKEYDLRAVDLERGLFGYLPTPYSSKMEWIGFEHCYYLRNE